MIAAALVAVGCTSDGQGHGAAGDDVDVSGHIGAELHHDRLDDDDLDDDRARPEHDVGWRPRLPPRTPGTLTVGVESFDVPYYQGTNPQTVNGGFEYDVAHAIRRRLHLARTVFVRSQFYEMANGPDCRCDVFISHVSITDPRARQVDFTQPYLEANKGVLVRSGTSVHTPEQARALRWAAVVRDTTSVALLADKVKPAGDPQLFFDFASCLAALASGQVDAVLYGAPTVFSQAFTDSRVVVAGQLETGRAVRDGAEGRLANTTELDDVVSGLRSDGTITRLAERWFGIDPKSVPVLPL